MSSSSGEHQWPQPVFSAPQSEANFQMLVERGSSVERGELQIITLINCRFSTYYSTPLARGRPVN